jgi:Flp pilus assembly pilin Flp
MKLLRRLWTDEAGFVVSSELVLIATLLVIGLVVGLSSLRNQVVQELTDTGQAIGMISQGYEYSGTRKDQVAQTDGSGWDDRTDFCQGATGADVPALEPGGIQVHDPDAGDVGISPLINNDTPGEES